MIAPKNIVELRTKCKLCSKDMSNDADTIMSHFIKNHLNENSIIQPTETLNEVVTGLKEL